MQKIKKNNYSILKAVAIFLDIVVLSYVALYMYWIFVVADMDTHPLTKLFATINPMTIGTYCLGITMLIHLVVFKNILSRCVICVSYFLSVVVSFIALMGMTGWNDMVMYIPNVVIICIAIIIVVKQINMKK